MFNCKKNYSDLLLFPTLNDSIACKKWAKSYLIILSTRCVYESYIFDMYVLGGFGIKWRRMVDMP